MARLKMRTLHMETTGIEVVKTCAEIEEYLIYMKATTIMKDIKDEQIEGVAFTIDFKGNMLSIRLPFRWQSIQELALQGLAKKPSGKEDQARRIAARQVLRWIQAQHALWYCDMVEVAEVFLPYVVNPKTGQTLFQTIETNPQRMLGSG